MHSKSRKILLPLSTIAFLMTFCFGNNNNIYASSFGSIGETDYTGYMVNQAYERLGFFSAQEKEIAYELFYVTVEQVQGNDDYKFSLELKPAGKEVVGAIGNDPASWSEFISANNITNSQQLTNKVNEVNSVRNQINSLLGASTVSGVNKTDVKVEIINGVHVLTSSTTGKSILSGADQSKLSELIKQYEKMTGIKFNANTILDALKFEENTTTGEMTLVFKPNYKHFKYIEKVVFTIKRLDGSGSVSAVLPLSQQLNTQLNSSISSKFRSITGQSFPTANVSGNSVTYDFASPVFNSGGSVHDTIREKWTGTTGYKPAIALKVNNNGLYEVTAKVYGGRYIENSARYKAELKVYPTPTHPYNNKTQEQVIGKKPTRIQYPKNSDYQKALTAWNKKKKEYDEKMDGYNKFKKQYPLNTQYDTTRYVVNYLNKNINSYKFNIKMPNPLVGTETGSQVLHSKTLETEYWPYKERYTYTNKTYNQIRYNIVETITSERETSKNIGNNKMPTYESKLINKAPDNKRSNELIGTYTWRVGAINKEIIIPSTSQNAEIGGALTK